MTNAPHSLPLAAVELLWARLGAVYGQRFIAQYDGMNLAVVKEDWRIRLAGLSDEQQRYALDNLPAGKAPPDVLEFRRLAIAMPDERRMARLGPPTGPVKVPQHVREALAKLHEEPAEPAHVQMARSYIARWEAEASKPEDQRMRPTPEQQQWIAHYRGVIARYEARRAVDPEQQAKDDARVAALAPTPAPSQEPQP